MATVTNSLVSDYCKVASALRPMLEGREEHLRRLNAILPQYPRLLERLVDEKRFDALAELSYARRRAQGAGYTQILRPFPFPEMKEMGKDSPVDYTMLEGADPLNKFAFMARMLRGMSSEERTAGIRQILPTYRPFLQSLSEQRSPLLDEFRGSQIAAVDALYGKAWPEFMALTIIGHDGHGGGIAYVDSREHSLMESVRWVLAENGKQKDNVTLCQPAAYFERYNDIPEELRGFGSASSDPGSSDDSYVAGKYVQTLDSVLSAPQDYLECAHFVAPLVSIRGLPLDDGAEQVVPLALNNWFGDTGKVHVTRHPYNPVWDA